MSPTLPLTKPVFTTTWLPGNAYPGDPNKTDIIDINMAYIVAPWTQQERTGGLMNERDARRQMEQTSAKMQGKQKAGEKKTQEKENEQTIIYQALAPVLERVYLMESSQALINHSNEKKVAIAESKNRRLFTEVAEAPSSQSDESDTDDENESDNESETSDESSNNKETEDTTSKLIGERVNDELLRWATAVLKVSYMSHNRQSSFESLERRTRSDEPDEAYHARLNEPINDLTHPERAELKDKVEIAYKILKWTSTQYDEFDATQFKYADE